jgi:hypothetical protein
MSIKFIDKLEPNGNFTLVDATHIQYEQTYMDREGEQSLDNVADALDILYTTVMAEPVLTFDTEEITDLDIATQCLHKTFALGTEVLLNLVLETRMAGLSTLTIYEEDKENPGLDNYKKLKSVTGTSGSNTISLGNALTSGTTYYKIKASDSSGRPAYYTYTYIDGDDETEKTQKLDYLLFKVVRGGMVFSPTFDNTKLFIKNSPTLEYAIKGSYPEQGYKWLRYQLFQTGSSETNTTGWKNLLLAGGQSVGGGVQIDEVATLNITDENGNSVLNADTLYTLQTQLIHSSSNTEVDLEQEIVANTAIKSSVISTEFEVLAENSIGLSVDASDLLGKDSSDYLTIKFTPKTTIEGTTYANNLIANCTILKDDNVTVETSRIIPCTHRR